MIRRLAWKIEWEYRCVKIAANTASTLFIVPYRVTEIGKFHHVPDKGQFTPFAAAIIWVLLYHLHAFDAKFESMLLLLSLGSKRPENIPLFD